MFASGPHFRGKTVRVVPLTASVSGRMLEINSKKIDAYQRVTQLSALIPVALAPDHGVQADLAELQGRLSEAVMEKVDLKKQFKSLYAPRSDDFSMVEVPPFNYLMVDGHGDPNSEPSYARAVEALFSVSYALKFMSKRELGLDYAVMPLEGLWWASDMDAFTARRKADWDWTMMILQPDWITSEMVDAARSSAMKKKDLPALLLLRFERLIEATSLQILHIGSYDDETPVLHRLHHQVMPDRGLTFAGKHHEIYLSDPRKVAPEKLRTILRQPVRPT